MTGTLALSVGQLVEFACRSGDLAAGIRGPSALEGVRAHQRWQRQRGENWRQEVSLKETITIDEPGLGYRQVTLQGRIDLLCEEQPLPIIEEIKSCYAPPERMAQGQKALHWAQLKIYGFLYLLAHQRTSVAVDDQGPTNAAQSDSSAQSALILRMLWLRLPQDQPYPQECVAHWSELHTFAIDALTRYLRWQQQIDRQYTACSKTANSLEFPYPAFRQGQRAMAADVYRSLRDGNKLLCEAPTGIGKTISALFPAIKALGTDLADRIVFLTAKNSGRLAATTALQCMAGAGLDVSYVIIQARQQACSCSNGGCTRDENGVCPRTVGFFDRLPAAREALLELRQLDDVVIADVAARYQLCPFELSLQMLPWCNVVICDYNFAFDPVAALGSLQQPTGRTGVLLDEAHNLVDRARQMHSATLTRQQLRHGANLATPDHPALSRALRGIDRALGRWHQQCSREQAGDAAGTRHQEDEYVSDELPATVIRAVHRCSEMQASVAADTGAAYPEELVECLRELHRFSTVAELAANHHRTISQRSQRGRTRDIALKLQCLDAADYLAKTYRRFHAVALFSATLSPSCYYQRALGLDEHSKALALPSPFRDEQQATIVCQAIDTRYRQRQRAIPAIAETIEAVVCSKPGNYMLFFASYHFMLQVTDALSERNPGLELRLQQRDASEAQRAAFLDSFRNSSAVLGCAIMGGVFGEGVDYPGDMLLGAIIVGTGLPGISTEQELLRHDYDATGLNGFDFAYRYPGICRVLQAAGRVIRSETDRGVVVLIDGRFATAAYRQLMPAHWQIQYCADPGNVTLALRSFWQREADAATSSDAMTEATVRGPGQAPAAAASGRSMA